MLLLVVEEAEEGKVFGVHYHLADPLKRGFFEAAAGVPSCLFVCCGDGDVVDAQHHHLVSLL